MIDEAASLSTETLLVRASELVLRVGDADKLQIETPDGCFAIAPLALGVLAAFEHPARLGDVLSQFEARGPEHFIEASSAVVQLHRAGVLHEPGARAAARMEHFVSPSIQASMLADPARTNGYLTALRTLVRPNDVVLDIGTGTGILATCAALAGARRIYAIESSGIATAAARVFDANRVNVELFRERSTRVTLPERATLLVTEIIGNEPFHEDILEVVEDARCRLLTSDARIIPSRIEVFAVPVDISRELLGAHAFLPEDLETHRKAYGVDLSPLVSHRIPPTQPILLSAAEASSLVRAGDPAMIVDVDLQASFETRQERTVTAALTRATKHLGVLVAFRATLAPGNTLAPSLFEIDPLTSWRLPLWPAWDHLALPAGTRIAVDYRYVAGRTTLHVRPA